MANFSTLFPNLQDNLDFTTSAGGVYTGTGAGSSNKVIHWAQSDDTSKIPKNKLPDISLGHTYTFSTAAASEALAIAAYTTLFGNGGGTEANGAITGDVLDAGDLVIITYDTSGTSKMLHLLYTGPQVTAGTNTPVDANFVNVTAGVTLTAGTNTSVGSDGTSIDLNASLTGITSIVSAAGVGFGLGAQDAVSTLSGLSTNIIAAGEIDLTGNAVDINATAGATINGTTVDLEAAGLLQLSSNRASGVAVDIDATQAAGTININAVGSTGVGSIVVDAGAGELRLSGEGIGTSGFLQVNSDGHVTTGTAGVGAYEIGTALIANQVAVLAGSTTYQLPSDGDAPIGSWIKIFQNGTSIIISGLTNTQSIVGASDNTLSLDDTSANFEMIKTAAATWRVLSS